MYIYIYINISFVYIYICIYNKKQCVLSSFVESILLALALTLTCQVPQLPMPAGALFPVPVFLQVTSVLDLDPQWLGTVEVWPKHNQWI